MKFKIVFVCAFLLVNTLSFAQAIIDTEASLKKIDTTFHVFANFMSDRKKGNVNLSFMRGDITLGSRKNNHLFRLTYAHNSTKFNGNLFDRSNTFQFRWNHIINEKNSLFMFVQSGNNLRSYIDQRSLIGLGWRKHLYLKNKDYFDLAIGPFREFEKYSSYSFNDESYPSTENLTTRISFNLFGSVKLFKNITALTTIYSQWRYNNINDVRVFGNQYIRFKVNEKVSTYLRYVLYYRSVIYVQPLKNDSDFLYGIEINI